MNTVKGMRPPGAGDPAWTASDPLAERPERARFDTYNASMAIETSPRPPCAMLPPMFSRHRLAEVAALLGDEGRAGMVLALWGGEARPAGELARIAGVTPATASAHLARLVAGGLLRAEPRGRHRYYRLAGPRVAEALESLSLLVPPHPARSAGKEPDLPPLRRARLCYDHVAGVLGVALSDALVARRLLALHDGEYA